jgi:hypothetical protein
MNDAKHTVPVRHGSTTSNWICLALSFDSNNAFACKLPNSTIQMGSYHDVYSCLCQKSQNHRCLYRVPPRTAPLFFTAPCRLFTVNKRGWKPPFVIQLLQNLEASLISLLLYFFEFAILESTVLCSINVRERHLVLRDIQRTS